MVAVLITKTCRECRRAKSVTEFHRRRHYVKSGYRAVCKACESVKESVRRKTHRLIELGLIEIQPCEVCGSANVHVHHLSYRDDDSAINVKFLCPLHHRQAHGKHAWTRQMELWPEMR